MDRSRTMPRLSLIVSLVLTLCGVILRTVCVLTYFDPTIGYFDAGALVIISNWLYAVAVVVAVASACLIPKPALATELHTPMRPLVAIPVGVSFVLFTVLGFVFCYANRVGNWLILCLVLALLASTYFFATATRSGQYSDKLTALGFLPVLWCIATIGETYTDLLVAINGPIKLSLQAGFIGLILILLVELRFRLGKRAPRLAVAGMSLGSFLCLVGSVPVLAGTIAGVLTNRLYLLYAIVLLCGGVYGAYTFIYYILGSGKSSSTTASDSSLPDNGRSD